MIEELKLIKSGKNDLRKFGITIGIILSIIAGYLYLNENKSFQIAITIGILLFVLGIASPVILKPIYRVWMIFATILGWMMTRVILSLLFFIVLTPIGLVSRLFGKSTLQLNWDQTNDSFWNYRDEEQKKKRSYEKQF